MIRQPLSALEIALLCRLYYLEPASTGGLRAPSRMAASLDAVMSERLRASTAVDLEPRLWQLMAEGFTALDRRGWRLTERGRAFAYEAGELEIQRLSGVWRSIAAHFEGRPPFQRVLDVGSAGGSAAVAMREAGLLAANAMYVGVDISHAALMAGIELSRLGAPDEVTGRVQGTAYRIPILSAAVDCCVSRSTLYYLQKRRVLAEMARVVRKGGYVIVAVPTIGYMARRALHGCSTLRPREAIKYALATLLGVAAWLGVDVRPPQALFTGETKRSLRTQLARVPGLRLVLVERLTLPFVGRPLLLVAEKLT